MIERNLKFEKHFQITSPDVPLIDHLKLSCPQLSKQKLKNALQSGAVWLGRNKSINRIRRAKKVLHVGDEIHVYYDENILLAKCSDAELVADEALYSLWNKPQGMFSQGTKWGDHCSIARWVEQNGFPQRPSFQVHRLDRATSGLVLVAHSKKVASQLTGMFENRKVEKRYYARVNGKFEARDIPLKIETKIDGKKSVSVVLSAQYDVDDDQSLLLVEIKTGRKHQIRRHLSELGFPIVGDRLYGNLSVDSSKSELPDLQLTACYLAFICPVTGEHKEYKL
ncbi:RluA family pseudouridine synthase [Aliikangiella coralliicola]|uniref:RluA family pseudouridine synthase n=1 Tax=Aliikangiella coralliicola TaxID=2592383 RepID=A0A545U715_9GAMM|nr:RluA family pseudouridine synthase [Aliikangiella coralliicola]TQV85279.1 RluA family pseudouridine synthase [Aliikangiella coralliicola]